MRIHGQMASSLPRRIFVVLSNVGIEATPVVVVDWSTDRTHRAIEDRMLVDLHVQATPLFVVDAFIPACIGSEQGELRERITMSKELSLEPIVEVEPVAHMIARAHGLLHLFAEGIVDEFILAYS